jgi:Ser/Thr protein kinase RdoA (MazF antagonist)
VTDALTVLARRWGAHEGTLSRVDRATNLVGRFQSDAGAFYLRVTTRAARSLSLLAGALDWQRHLFMSGAPVAEPVPSAEGFWIETASSGSTTCVATATRAVPGRAVDFGNLTEIAAWAEAVGRVHDASERYTPSPVSTTTRTVNGELPTLVDLWKQIESIAAIDPVLVERYAQGSQYLAGMSEQTLITHADVRPENAVVSDGRVVLLDFDEPTVAWAPYDLARMMLDDDARPPRDSVRHLSAIRDGYQRGRPAAPVLDDAVEQFLNIRVLLMYAWSLQDPSGSTETWLPQLRSLLCSPLSL